MSSPVLVTLSWLLLLLKCDHNFIEIYCVHRNECKGTLNNCNWLLISTSLECSMLSWIQTNGKHGTPVLIGPLSMPGFHGNANKSEEDSPLRNHRILFLKAGIFLQHHHQRWKLWNVQLIFYSECTGWDAFYYVVYFSSHICISLWGFQMSGWSIILFSVMRCG